MAELLLTARLLGHAAVRAQADTRIYPLVIPQDPPPVYPGITYQRITSDHVASLQGHSGLVDARVQIDVWALSYAGAKALAREVKAAITEPGADKLGGLLLTDLDDYEPDTRLYRVSMDFSIWYSDEVTN